MSSVKTSSEKTAFEMCGSGEDGDHFSGKVGEEHDPEIDGFFAIWRENVNCLVHRRKEPSHHRIIVVCLVLGMDEGFADAS